MTDRFYVTVVRGKGIGARRRTGFLAGPFVTHDAALAQVGPARKLACELDPFCAFDAFGTAKRASDRPGVLNARLGIPRIRERRDA